MNIGFGIPQIGIILISLLDSLLWFSMTLTSPPLMMFTLYPNNPVNEILPHGDTTHFVSFVWNHLHYAVLYYNIDTRSVTVFDGLNQDIRKWQDHIIHTVKTYGLKPPFSSATCKFQYDLYVDKYVRRRKEIGEERYDVGD